MERVVNDVIRYVTSYCNSPLSADQQHYHHRRSKLPVHSAVVPLSDAMKVSGLRAVFGDHYPDPVRVVSLGPQVSDLISNPEDGLWPDFSVEFCGGTHIRNTEEAVAFVITGQFCSVACVETKQSLTVLHCRGDLCGEGSAAHLWRDGRARGEGAKRHGALRGRAAAAGEQTGRGAGLLVGEQRGSGDDVSISPIACSFYVKMCNTSLS